MTIDPSLAAALTPYILILGSFSYPLLKILRLSRTYARIYGFIYVLLSLILTFHVYMGCFKEICIYKLAGFPPPIGITYVVDNLSGFIAFITSILFLLMYPLMRNFVDDNEYFYGMLLALEAAMIGVIYTGDIFNLFVMIELLSIASYTLITSYNTRYAFRSAFKYAMIASVSGMFVFLGAVLYYNVLGTLNIGHGAAILEGMIQGIGRGSDLDYDVSVILMILFWALMVETAIVPLHFWLPDAYSSAPPPIAGLLAGLSEGIGFYVLMRLYYVLLKGFTWITSLFLGVLGMITIVIGGFGMIYSRNALKIISYSIILDAGYIAVALSLGEPGVYIALSYIVAHIVVKPLLFLSIGYITHHKNTYDLDLLSGSLRGNPVLLSGFLVGASAVVGIPPTILFQAKLQLYISVLDIILENPSYYAVSLIVMVIGSVLALTGFARILYPLLFKPGKPVEKPSGYLLFFILLFLILVIVLGILYVWIYNSYILPAGNSIVSDRLSYISKVFESLGGMVK